MTPTATYLALFAAGVVVGRLTKRTSETASRAYAAPNRPLPTESETRIRALLADRKKIDAIKAYREATGCGLKEAKEAVEAL